MTPDEFAVYSLLNFRAPIAPALLAAALGMQRSTMSNYLTRMDDRRDLVRRAHADDGRSALIELSSSGKARMTATIPFFARAFLPFERALGTRRGAATKALRQISAALDEAAEELASTRAESAAD
jgi:DNA-binding MarR family transcriptional regulator